MSSPPQIDWSKYAQTATPQIDFSKYEGAANAPQGLTDAERTQLKAAYDARPWWRKTLGLGSADPEAQRLEQKDLAAQKPAIQEGMQDFYSHNPGGVYAMGTASNLAQGGQELAQGEIKKGAHHIIKGATIGASPLMVPMAASAPVAAATALLGGAGGSALGSVGAKALGGDEDTQQLAADIGGLLGGYAGGRVGSKITGAGFKNIVNALDKLAPPGSMQADLVKLVGGYRYTKGMDVLRKVADLVPDNVAADTHPSTSKVLNDALEQTLGPMPKGGEERAIGVLPTGGGAPQSPASMAGYYGKYSGQSNLAKNQQQMAAFAASKSPQGPTFVPKSEPTAEDLKFQDANLANILQATIGQLRRAGGR